MKKSEIPMLLLLVFLGILALGCGGALVYAFYMVVAKVLGFLLGAFVGAFVHGYHLLNS